MKTVVFINAHSRRAADLIDDVRAFFAKATSGFDVIDFIVVEDLDSLDDCLARLRSHKTAECVVVGSGDGTIGTVLNAMRSRKDLIYGFLPLGTSNNFVRSLKLPLDLTEALAVLDHPQTQEISLGEVNGHVFANIAAIGLPTDVAGTIPDKFKRIFGSLAYVLSGMHKFLSHEAIKCELTADGVTRIFYTHHLLIANGHFHGNLPVAERASLVNDNLFVVSFGTDPSRWQYAVSMMKFRLSWHESDRKVLTLPITSAVIRTKPICRIETDGEVIGKTPAEVRVLERVVRVLIPAAQEQTEEIQAKAV